MRNALFFLILLSFSCSKNHICEERGSGNLEPYSDEYFMTGELNGEPWYASVSGFGLNNNNVFSFGCQNLNKCDIPEALFTFVSDTMPKVATKHLLEDNQISFSYNYGYAWEVVVSPSYTKVINTPSLTNYFLFSALSPDSTVLEGEFEVHLVKNYQPESNEPDAIIIKNGRFRLRNQFKK